MGVLGKVTGDLDAPRGPDVAFQITVPADWFGREISVLLPRNLHCAACSGGGCDRCDRSGAITLRARADEPKEVRIALPPADLLSPGVCLRIPEQGGAAMTEGVGRGHLLLTVRRGEEASRDVSLTHSEGILSGAERHELMKRSVLMAVGLILLFLGMLKLSGWL